MRLGWLICPPRCDSNVIGTVFNLMKPEWSAGWFNPTSLSLSLLTSGINTG